MASSLEKKQIDELLAKYQASAVRKQRHVEELERRNKNLLAQISSSLIVPACAFGMSYARACYGDEASPIGGMPIDAAAGLVLTGLATLLDCSSNEEAQTAAKFLHDFGNGALASWSSSLGAELGAKKRLEKPLPAPQPNAGAEKPPERTSRPLTHEELDEIIAAMSLKAQPAMPERPPAPLPRPHAPPPGPLPPPVQQKVSPAMPERPPAPPPVHAPPPAPPPMPAQQKTSLPSTTKSVAAKVPAPTPAQQSAAPKRSPSNERATPAPASAKSEAAPMAPSAPQKPNRVNQEWTLDPEAEMRALLQSHGAPTDPKTVAYVLTHKNSIEAYRQIVGRVRAPVAAPSSAQKPSRATKPWVLDPEAEMRRLLRSRGAPSDPKTVNYLLSHENTIEAFREILREAHVPRTKPAAASVPAPSPMPRSSAPPQSPLNAPPPTKKTLRRSLVAARTVGITEAVGAASPPMTPKTNPIVQESSHSVQLAQEELEAAERWRLATAA